MRVIVDDDAARHSLRRELADHLADEPAPLGFVLRVPERPRGFHLVLDRTGFVLGRSRSLDDAVTILRRHLRALAPPAAGSTRYRVRTLLGGDGRVHLATFPLFVEPAAVERRLQRVGARIVDAICADVRVSDESGGTTIVPSPDSTEDVRDIAGHAPLLSQPTELNHLLVPALGQLTPARVVAQLSHADVQADDRAASLDLAAHIARTPVGAVDNDDPLSPYGALS